MGKRGPRRALVVPTVGGLVLFVDQWRAGSPDSPLLPIFCVLIMVWAAMFLDLWRRRNSEVSFRWGVDGAEDDELGRVAAKQVCARFMLVVVARCLMGAREGLTQGASAGRAWRTQAQSCGIRWVSSDVASTLPHILSCSGVLSNARKGYLVSFDCRPGGEGSPSMADTYLIRLSSHVLLMVDHFKTNLCTSPQQQHVAAHLNPMDGLFVFMCCCGPRGEHSRAPSDDDAQSSQPFH